MKIAVFHNLHSGGAKRALYGYIKYFTQSGYTVDVFVPSTANEDFLSLQDIAHQVKVFPVKDTLTGKIYSFFKYYHSTKISLRDLELAHQTMAQEINNADYDVVLCEQDIYILAPFLLKHLKKPHIYYCQQPPFLRYRLSRNILQGAGIENESYLERNFFLKYYFKNVTRIDKENIKKASYVIANSYFSRESILREYGINSYVSYLGVDTQHFQPRGVEKENFVLSVGQCIPEKGYDFLIKALSHLDPDIRPELVIVSDLEESYWKQYLQNLATKLNVNLKLLNLISDEELVLLYNKAKLVTYTPYLEPFGLVPLEAMACGTPVVAVKEGGMRESVEHGQSGLLVDRDQTLFAQAVADLLSDPQRRSKMAENSIKIAKEFWSLDKAGERLVEHLNHAINLYKNK